MPNPHSNVIYIEPNSMNYDWDKSNTNFEKAPRLEEYCIALNLEVEVCSRTNSGTDSNKKVYILSWDNKGDKVSFMSGTKIGGYNYNGTTRTSKLDPNGERADLKEVLTTYYADMYVGDLVNHGTTEMIGIKSVNIQYQKSCVPIIDIQFTDVRGLSLLQPTELNYNKSYNGIKGLDATNIAQSFFQCFYKMPLPKFTIYIKGFYGRPVSYEMMCDNFDTSFNSETGNFDVKARFVGYSYSFLTDVTLDALLCAPYSDYEGQKYWNDNVENGRFCVFDKNGNPQRMPTLFDVKSGIYHLVNNAPKELNETTIEAEDETHEDEKIKLDSIRRLYESWYSSLYKELTLKFGKKYCTLFKENGDDGDYYRIIALIPRNDNTLEEGNDDNLGSFYNDFSDSFKILNKKLYTTIAEYNNDKSAYTSLPQVSLDFKEYKRQEIFKPCYIDSKTQKIKFNGFSELCKISADEIISVMFADDNKDYMTHLVFNDGENQYIDGYVVNVDYSSIKRQLNALQKNANNTEDVIKKKTIQQFNDEMIGKLGWYPSIENFTRIMLAHLETLMEMMFKVTNEINADENRKASKLGISISDIGISDVNEKDDKIPPFPRVTKEVDGKIEDDWVGNLGFKEVEIVDGIFNAVELISEMEGDEDTINQKMNSELGDETASNIKYPLTPFDFFLTGNPYGNSSELENNINDFAAKICMRMFSIFSLNNFFNEYNLKITDSKIITLFAELEAENFNNSFKFSNTKLLRLLRNDGLNANNIIDLIKTNKSIDGSIIPWGEKRKLFDDSMNLIGYDLQKPVGTIYPLQNPSFSELEETYKCFKEGKIQIDNSDILLTYTNCSKRIDSLLKSNNNSIFNILYIDDNFNKISEKLNDSTVGADETYKVFFDTTAQGLDFNEEEYKSLINLSEENNFKKITKNGLAEISKEDLDEYVKEAINGDISNFTLKTSPISSDDSVILANIIKLLDIKGIEVDINNMMSFVLGLNCINYVGLKNLLSSKKSILYIPKLAALQIGAVLFGIKNNLNTKISSFPNSLNIGELKDYFNIQISQTTKTAYIKYFYDWAKTTNSFIGSKNLASKKNKTLLKNITNELMSPIIISPSVFSWRPTREQVQNNLNIPTIGERSAKLYLEKFLGKLKELNNIDISVDENGNMTKMTKTPQVTSEEMKKELYRYLKLLYDKWIPNSTLDDWKLETFFDYKDFNNNNGHLFHFIDSYYNKIGNKLLVNPLKLAEKIKAAFDNNEGDVSVMMLGFMAEIYAENKCMLLSLQNFMDLSNPDNMRDMFKTFSYNEMPSANKHPDFVVVYPYEPSKYLNVDNAEYTDDSFMLNDENETPLAIKSRNDDENSYKIPAFGVTYGKQYQNYFKNVNVNMQSPIATQQSILMKHSILKASRGGKLAGTAGQNLYDIYSTQSYTCTVEMMGCAWVQPLMYFVLLNVPMFRGSYIILSVTHKITPGNMVTEFTGTRMSKYATPLNQDVFFGGEDPFGGERLYEETRRTRKANVDNDCPYKVYPLEEDYGDNKNHMKMAMTAMDILINQYEDFTPQAAAGICGNIYAESTWQLHVTNGIGAFGLCQWTSDGNRKQKLIKKYGDAPTLAQQMEYINDEWHSGDPQSHQALSALTRAESASKAAVIVMNAFERPSPEEKAKSVSIRKSKAEEYFKAYQKRSTATATTNTSDSKTDVRELMKNALKKSYYSTDVMQQNGSIVFNYKTFEYKGYNLTLVDKKNILSITGNKENLAIVFDMLLNGYYNNVQELWWFYSNSPSEENPIEIYVLPSLKVEPQYRVIHITRLNKNLLTTNYTLSVDSVSKKIIKSLSKKYSDMDEKIFGKEVPQLASEYEKIQSETVTSCSDAIGDSDAPVVVEQVDCLYENGKIGDWNTDASTKFLMNYAKSKSSSKCWNYVKRALEVGGFKRDNSIPAYTAVNFLKSNNFGCIYKGTVKGHSGSDYPNKCIGDITVFDKYEGGDYGHIDMWCGEQWISDFKQGGNWINTTAKAAFTVWRYKGSGMKKS